MKIISIDKEDCAKVQLAHAELEVLQDTFNSFVAAHEHDMELKINERYIDIYTQQLARKKMAFDSAKTEMINKYAPGTSASWNLDYNTCELRIEDSNSTCCM